MLAGVLYIFYNYIYKIYFTISADPQGHESESHLIKGLLMYGKWGKEINST